MCLVCLLCLSVCALSLCHYSPLPSLSLSLSLSLSRVGVSVLLLRERGLVPCLSLLLLFCYSFRVSIRQSLFPCGMCLSLYLSISVTHTHTHTQSLSLSLSLGSPLCCQGGASRGSVLAPCLFLLSYASVSRSSLISISHTLSLPLSLRVYFLLSLESLPCS
jgi:hypothetical protein